jgi:hypothetical protein
MKKVYPLWCFDGAQSDLNAPLRDHCLFGDEMISWMAPELLFVSVQSLA